MAQRTFLGIISDMGGGAIPPVVAMAQGLVERGHRVVMICERSSSQQFVDTEIDSIVIPESSELRNFWDMAHILEWNKTLTAGGSLDDVENAYTSFGNAAFDDVIDAVRNIRPDGIFTSLFTLGLAESLGHELQVPWTFVNPAYAFAEGSTRSVREDFQRGLAVYIREKWMPQILESAALVLHATDREFDPTTDELPANNYHVGPLNLVASVDPPSYLTEDGPPWALVSVSLGPNPGELEIVESALRSLANEDMRVLVTAPHRADSVKNVPSNATVVDRAPHDLVLQNSRIAISSSGHGLVMKSLIHGVPMVLVPWGRDQAGVAWRASQLGTAEVVGREELSDDSMAGAVRKVLDNDSYTRRAKEVSARMAGEDPIAMACELIENAVG